MRTFKFLTLIAIASILALPQLVLAKANVTGGPLKGDALMAQPTAAPLEQKRPDAPWIYLWYAPDGGYMDSGGFNTSGPKDLIKEGTGGKLTQVELSTKAGLLKTKTVKIDWGKNQMKGAKGDWTVISLGSKPEEPSKDDKPGRNMSSRYGLNDTGNFDTYQILVLDAPDDMKSIMSPAQDDYAQIWVNGEKWHNDTVWTGHPTIVNFDIEVSLKKGANVLVYRCGEGGGHDYANLHLDDTTMKVAKIYPKAAKDKAGFFAEVDPILGGATAVKLQDKLPTTWAGIKAKKL